MRTSSNFNYESLTDAQRSAITITTTAAGDVTGVATGEIIFGTTAGTATTALNFTFNVADVGPTIDYNPTETFALAGGGAITVPNPDPTDPNTNLRAGSLPAGAIVPTGATLTDGDVADTVLFKILAADITDPGGDTLATPTISDSLGGILSITLNGDYYEVRTSSAFNYEALTDAQRTAITTDGFATGAVSFRTEGGSATTTVNFNFNVADVGPTIDYNPTETFALAGGGAITVPNPDPTDPNTNLRAGSLPAGAIVPTGATLTDGDVADTVLFKILAADITDPGGDTLATPTISDSLGGILSITLNGDYYEVRTSSAFNYEALTDAQRTAITTDGFATGAVSFRTEGGSATTTVNFNFNVADVGPTIDYNPTETFALAGGGAITVPNPDPTDPNTNLRAGSLPAGAIVPTGATLTDGDVADTVLFKILAADITDPGGDTLATPTISDSLGGILSITLNGDYYEVRTSSAFNYEALTDAQRTAITTDGFATGAVSFRTEGGSATTTVNFNFNVADVGPTIDYNPTETFALAGGGAITVPNPDPTDPNTNLRAGSLPAGAIVPTGATLTDGDVADTVLFKILAADITDPGGDTLATPTISDSLGGILSITLNGDYYEVRTSSAFNYEALTDAQRTAITTDGFATGAVSFRTEGGSATTTVNFNFNVADVGPTIDYNPTETFALAGGGAITVPNPDPTDPNTNLRAGSLPAWSNCANRSNINRWRCC